MSDQARDYVSDLDGTRVSRRQKALLFVLASYHDVRYQSANIGLDTLCNDLLVDRRWLRRIIASLVESELLLYVPGGGSGNFGQFQFRELGGVEKPVRKHVEDLQTGVKRGSIGGQTGVTSDTPIRKDLNLNPSQNQNPPYPPSSKGGEQYRLTHRDHQRLARYWNRKIDKPSDRSLYWGPLVREACADMAICYDDAVHDLLLMDFELWASRLDLRKAPQSA